MGACGRLPDVRLAATSWFMKALLAPVFFVIIALECLLNDGSARAAVTNSWPAEGDAADAVGTADGVLTGGVSFGEGSVGQGFVFDGVDGEVSFGTEAGNVGASDFTISFAIRTTVENEVVSVLSKRDICGFSAFWDIRSGVTGRLSLELYQSVTNTGVATVLPVNDGAFHDVVFVREGTTVMAYVDRVLTVRNDSGIVADMTNAAELLAGLGVCVGMDGTVPFSGTLDELRISDTADPPKLCGDTVFDNVVTATDALATLRTAVGLQTCEFCLCDVNDSGNVSAADALAILRLAVGQLIPVTCPACS
jgi:hypothetical protein